MEKLPADRKDQHVRCCLEKDVKSSVSPGFEKYILVNQPLPEITLGEIDTSTMFLGKRITAPFVIEPITGGTEVSIPINKNLAKAAQKIGVVMSVGSQKQALENPSLIPTYRVRDVAPDVPVLANLGAIYLNYGYGVEECKQAVEMIEADGLFLYLNPLQKIIQGSPHIDFRDLVQRISKVCRELGAPVIAKEVGFGLSSSAAVHLEEAGVWAVDIAGAGGTSWAKIERLIKEDGGLDPPFGDTFDNWGTPTAESLVSIVEVIKDIPIIASGGIRNGLDMAKAIALGASYVGMALPLLAPAMESSEAVEEKILTVLKEFKTAMFLCGKRNLEELKTSGCARKIGE